MPLFSMAKLAREFQGCSPKEYFFQAPIKGDTCNPAYAKARLNFIEIIRTEVHLTVLYTVANTRNPSVRDYSVRDNYNMETDGKATLFR